MCLPRSILLVSLLVLVPSETSLLARGALPVTNLECMLDGDDASLTWANSEIYTFVEIERQGALHAILPGNATSFTDSGVTGLGLLYGVRGVVGTDGGFAQECIVGPPPELRISSGTGSPGQLIELFTEMDNSYPLQGWSMGVSHDSDKLTLLDVEEGPALLGLNGGDGPSFYSSWISTNPPGFSSSVVVDFLNEDWLQPGVAHQLDVLTYSVDAPAPDSTTIEFCTCIGNPAVNTTVVAAGMAIDPIQTPGVVTIVEVQFIRGDVNDDGGISLGDAIALLEILFGPDIEACFDTADVDASGSLNLGDAIGLLSFQFGSGAPPAPPFPTCGSPPTTPDCELYQSCP